MTEKKQTEDSSDSQGSSQGSGSGGGQGKKRQGKAWHPAGSPKAAPRRSGWVAFAVSLALLSLLLSASLAVAAWWFWDQYEDRQDRVEALEAELADQGSRLDGVSDRADAIPTLESELQALAESLDSDVSERRELADRVERVDQRTETLRDFIDAGQSAWVLAEVEYLLRVASAEMQLAGRHDSADAALAAADQRLEALADPGLTEVRAAIARDRDRLRGLSRVDVSGMALTLGSLMERVDELPVAAGRARDAAAADQAEDGETLPWWRQLKSRGSEVLQDLVTIRHEDAPVRPLLAPEQEYFLRRNLTLSLATARLALLEEEPEIWRASIAEARDWLDRYFDGEDRRVEAMEETLAELADQGIRQDRPDVSAALERLRTIREARN